MELLQNGLALINSIPADAWNIITDILLSAIVVSPVALGLKKWWSVHSEKVMLFLVIIGSMVSSALVYVLNAPELSAWVIPVQGWLVFATTQPVYFLFIKPLFRRLGDWLTSEVAKAQAIQAERDDIRSAVEPTGGLAVVPTVSPAPTLDEEQFGV